MNKLDVKFKQLAKEFDFKVFILFGSRATHNYSKQSDWDFAYVRNKELSFEEKSLLWDKLHNITSSETFDIVHLNSTYDPLLKKEIFTKGKLLFGEMNLFNELQSSAVLEYLDFEPNYQTQKEIIEKRLELLS